MPPSSGHLLLPKVWRAARFAYEKAWKSIKTKFPEPVPQNSLRYQPAYARINPRQPINRAAAIRQARSRHFSTRATDSFVSYIRSGLQGGKPTQQASRVASNISRITSRAPFASTLRPNLTGGTLCRTAGGYAIGAGRVGGARYFSHGPAAPAQVINNVSVGMRAFFLSGQKVRFDGIDSVSGNKKYKAVTMLQDKAEQQMMAIPRAAPGSFIDFQLSPTITAFGLQKKFDPNGAFQSETINSDGLLDFLSADFARALKDLAAVLNDLKRLSALGDLPILLHDKSTIRVRFPGCDANTVERLCDEVGVQRGKIVQDEEFDTYTGADVALCFPFAPSAPPSLSTEEFFYRNDPSEAQKPEEVDWQAMMSPEANAKTLSSHLEQSGNKISFEDATLFAENPWISSSSGYSSINISELGDRALFPEASSAGFPESCSGSDGVEGIHRFLAECDHAARYN